MTWKDLTVRQYQDIQDTVDGCTDDFDRVCLTVSIIFGLTHEQVNNMAPKRFLKLSKRVEEIFKYEPEGSAVNRVGRYRVNYNVASFKWRQYVEIQHWLREPIVHAFPLVLASSVNPLIGFNSSKHHKGIVKRLAGYSFIDCYFSVKKILENLANLNSLYNPRLEAEDDPDESQQEVEIQEELPEEDFGDSFEEKWGWIYSTKRIAEYRGITLDQAYELTTLQALNSLQFIKDLQKHEEKLFEDAKRKSQQH